METALESIATEQNQNLWMACASPLHSVLCYFGSMCQSEVEDVRHAMFACSRAKQVWRALGIEQEIESLLAVDRSGSVVIQEAIGRGVDELCVGTILV